MFQLLFNLSQFRRREEDFLVTNRLFLFYGSLLLCKVTTDTPLTSVNVFVSVLVHKLHVKGLLRPLINSTVYGILTLQEPGGRLLCGTSVKAFLQVSKGSLSSEWQRAHVVYSHDL